MRRFHLQRDKDESGVSGTGRVAEGVLLNNGWVITEWNSHHKEIITSESIAVFEKLHGHDGKAQVVWHDPDPYEEKKKNGHTDERSPTPTDGGDSRQTGEKDGTAESGRSGKVRTQTEEDQSQGGEEQETQAEDAPEED